MERFSKGKREPAPPSYEVVRHGAAVSARDLIAGSEAAES
jgi:hypothetical protein